MNTKIKFISSAFLVIISLFVLTAIAQDTITPKVDEFVKAEMQKQ